MTQAVADAQTLKAYMARAAAALPQCTIKALVTECSAVATVYLPATMQAAVLASHIALLVARSISSEILLGLQAIQACSAIHAPCWVDTGSSSPRCSSVCQVRPAFLDLEMILQRLACICEI